MLGELGVLKIHKDHQYIIKIIAVETGCSRASSPVTAGVHRQIVKHIQKAQQYQTINTAECYSKIWKKKTEGGEVSIQYLWRHEISYPPSSVLLGPLKWEIHIE